MNSRGDPARPQTRSKPRSEQVSGVSFQDLWSVARQILDHHFRGECGKTHAGIETACGQRRHCAGRVADKQTILVCDVSQYAADGNVTRAAFNLFRVAQVDQVRNARAESLQRRVRIKSGCITTDAKMCFFTVVSDPSDVTG